ncbi:hypothetical protein [Bacillus pumilus]|uniref:hypothetical protein n=1 Tax=Bacillus pumilus TaxID=1408 RepID=UPI0020406482|nr:hypothetical protein [Bacillus pumilus]MCM3148466.1 hypothetical protein [Bacillus pumilus]
MSDKQNKTTPAATEVDDERMQAKQLLNDINSGNISINEARSVLGLLSLANPEANLKGCLKQPTRTLIVGANTRHARALWQDLKKKFPQYKYSQFVSMNPAKLDGVNPSETILILLPGYSRNPIINCYEFQWLKENAIEVIHINEEEIK